jgi:hypothetical protein
VAPVSGVHQDRCGFRTASLFRREAPSPISFSAQPQVVRAAAKDDTRAQLLRVSIGERNSDIVIERQWGDRSQNQRCNQKIF